MGLLRSDESMHSTWTISRREGHEAKYIYACVGGNAYNDARKYYKQVNNKFLFVKL